MRSSRPKTTPTADSELAELVSELTDLLHDQQSVDFESFVAKHSKYEQSLRQVWPSLQAMADIKSISSHDAQPGNVDEHPECLGDFRIVGELGRGGMGIVYEAEQISLARRVALKVLPFAALLDRRRLERFKNEARAAAMLKHPNIVSVYSIGVERAVHFYAMEMIDGINLDALARRRSEESVDAAFGHEDLISDTSPIAALSTAHSTDRKSFHRRIAQLMSQAAAALEYAHHQGVVHRDIKPSNLLLDQDGQVHVADFGLAQVRAGDGLTVSGDVVGTLRYMSPEQLEGHVVDERTDIYSLGVTLYEMVTLQPVYTSSNRADLTRCIIESEPCSPRSVDRSIPADLETIILKSIAKEPNERYATMRDLANDLQAFLDSRPIRAKQPTWLQRASKWLSRNQTVAWSAAACLLVLSSVVAIAWQREAALHRLTLAKSAALQHLIGDILDTSYQLRHQADSNVLRQQLDEAVEVFENLIREQPDDESKLALARLCARRANNSFGQGIDASADIERAHEMIDDVAPRKSEQTELLIALHHLNRAEVFCLASDLRWSECVALNGPALDLRIRSHGQVTAEDRSWHFSHQSHFLCSAGRLINARLAARRAVVDSLEAEEENGLAAHSLYSRYQLLLTSTELGYWSKVADQSESLRQVIQDLPPGDPHLRPFREYWKSMSLCALAKVANYRHAPDAAAELLTTARSRARESFEAHPNHVWWMRCLASCNIQFSDSLVLKGEPEQALELLLDTIQLFDACATESVWDRFEQARVQYRLALLYSKTGHIQDAKSELETAIAQFESICAARPNEPYCSRPLIAARTLNPFARTDDTSRAQAMISTSVGVSSGLYLRYVALANFRAGEFKKAHDAIVECIHGRSGGDAIDWLIACLVMHRTANERQAIEYFRRAKHAIQSKDPVVFADTGPLAIDLLLEEAERVAGP